MRDDGQSWRSLMTITSVAGARPDWRRRMRGELFLIFLAKLAALTLLWMLFFSASHRAAVDGSSVSRQLGVSPTAPSRTPLTPSVKEVSRG
jgi:hypothetical protein